MKHSVKLSLKQMYVCKHSLQKTLEIKQRQARVCELLGETEIFEELMRDIQSEECLMKKFINEIEIYKKNYNIT